jgi:pilus assembly protein Flp/PilA
MQHCSTEFNQQYLHHLKEHHMKQFFSNLMNDESGQDLIEYALVAGLIGLGAVTAMSGLSTKIGTAFTSIGTTLSTNV